ncbi:MAG: phosphate signaling complex protein PhoU [Planctomycetaceae bacterium]|nr:phosphate signaling complex protein PhoU [Planctomycetaceae bacterium]
MSQHLPRQLTLLKQKLLLVGTYVEEAFAKAITALINRDRNLAISVIEGDAEIDRLEVDCEEECLKTLALYQPVVATDLRFVVAVLKINNDLERMGDLSRNIAKRVVLLSEVAPQDMVSDLRPAASRAQAMMKRALDSFVHLDVTMAHAVRRDDDEVDVMRREFQRRTLELIRQEPQSAEIWLALNSVSKHIERLADMAVNVAEEVIYLVEGAIVRHTEES